MSEQRYRDTFARLGRALTPKDACSPPEIDAAEVRLGCAVPGPLRAFYSVAGRATDWTDHHDHFEPPENWWLDGQRLVFLSENQGVVIYAVDVQSRVDDPPVVMASNDEPYEWHEVCPRLSDFLDVMLHVEAGLGGTTPFVRWALVNPDIRRTLEADFKYVGEVNELRAYNQMGAAICFVKWDDGWRILVGASSAAVVSELELRLGVEWDA